MDKEERKSATDALREAERAYDRAVLESRVNEEPTPVIEAGDKLIAAFADEDVMDEFSICVQDVRSTKDPYEVAITAKVRLSRNYWEELRRDTERRLRNLEP